MLLRACNTELHALQPVTEDDVFSTDATHERDVELLFRKPGPLGMKLKPDKVKNLHSVQSVHAVGQAMDWCSMVRAFYVRLLNPNPTQPRPNSSVACARYPRRVRVLFLARATGGDSERCWWRLGADIGAPTHCCEDPASTTIARRTMHMSGSNVCRVARRSGRASLQPH